MPDLFIPGIGHDPMFEFVRDSDSGKPLRDLLEAEWGRFEPLADRQFSSGLALDFEGRTWEMRVGALLVELHTDHVSSGDRGLDFLVRGDPAVWVECVAPDVGIGDAAVPPIPDGVVFDVPEDAVMLRYSSVIADKLRGQVAKGRDRGTVSDDQAIVIAISGAKIPHARSDVPNENWRTLPQLPFRLLYGFGTPSLRIPVGGAPIAFLPPNPTTPKPGREPVTTAFFGSPAFKHLSAVLYTPLDMQRRPELYGHAPGCDLSLFHNPFASVPLPRGWLPQGVEFWAEGPDWVIQRTTGAQRDGRHATALSSC